MSRISDFLKREDVEIINPDDLKNEQQKGGCLAQCVEFGNYGCSEEESYWSRRDCMDEVWDGCRRYC